MNGEERAREERRPLRAEIAVSVLAFINAGRRCDAKSVSLESRANKRRTRGEQERGERRAERAKEDPRDYS